MAEVADPAELEAYALIEGSGLVLPKGERIKGRFVLHNRYDETTDLWAVLKGAPNIGVVLSAEQFAQASGELAGLDLNVEAYRSDGDAADEPKVRSTAALPVTPPTKTMADERDAEAFKIMNVTVGMTEPEVLAAIASEFAPDQITADPEGGTLLARKGACDDTDPVDPAIASETGAFCLELQFADGVVSRVALRQVVPGDVAARALAAFRERYGEPVFEDQSRPRPSVQRSVIGWGRPLSKSPPDLAGIGADAPRTVLEARVWRSNGVTVAVLHLDDGRPAEGSDGLAGGQEIKF